MKHWIGAILTLLGVVTTGVVAQQSPSEGKAPVSSKQMAATSLPKPATVDPNYKIGPGDQLYINVWKEPDLTASVPVRPDGKISMPLLNDVQAAGLTPMQLSADVTNKLNKYVEQPHVTVVVTGTNSRLVYVVGQVGRAGSIPLLPEMTILQALSSVGGISEFANGKKIYVLRVENGKPQRYYFNYKEALKGEHPEQNILLKPGDTIVVP
jgi:polysaccharide export outer membrane protein